MRPMPSPPAEVPSDGDWPGSAGADRVVSFHFKPIVPYHRLGSDSLTCSGNMPGSRCWFACAMRPPVSPVPARVSVAFADGPEPVECWPFEPTWTASWPSFGARSWAEGITARVESGSGFACGRVSVREARNSLLLGV